MQFNGLDYLNTRLMFGMQPGLESTQKLCHVLGNPQSRFKSIHVVGTNGKGSTSYYLAGILKAHGLKVGLFTSPHLVSLCERIRIDDVPIALEDLDRYLLRVRDAAQTISANEDIPFEPTFFEVLTLVGFLYYADQGVDVAVLEAGMGGRLDSTAVAQGEMAVVTSIGLEHTEVLGSTEAQILKEKMGVLGNFEGCAKDKSFILGGLSGGLLQKANEYAGFLGARVLCPEVNRQLVLANLGQHYKENASLSISAAKEFLKGGSREYKAAVVEDCLPNLSWAGRMQLLKNGEGKVQFILDGAHNSHAVKRLVESIAEYYPGVKFRCIFGALKDKDVSEMLKFMAPFVDSFYLTKTMYPRFRELDELKKIMQDLNLEVGGQGIFSREFIDQVRKESDPRVPVLITGSLYMIGECILHLRDDYAELSYFKGLLPSTNEHR
ncbi:MAG: bifunctional folylpolyglutamate synthase/dihydrofolate synthase [Fibrobacter sp.]|nr:bifunctional folylpolyglutamate synthase/dihydrofolate synthase [Fibrobacter sp.]